MENVTKLGPSFVFLGLLELEKFRFLYASVALLFYLITMLLCCLIVYVIWIEVSLHEPMYIFIGNLIFNGVFGNTVILPPFIISLLNGSSTISFNECLTQVFCVQSFSTVEILTFTAMAYDRYLAVGYPLRYATLMTNGKALKYIEIIWISGFVLVVVPLIMTANLTFCGVNINNIFCDNMSLVRLACGNSAMVNNIFGLVETLLVIFGTCFVIVYCYVRTLLICLKLPRAAYLKAMHTLSTHIITFSVFLTASLFVVLRYRLNGGTITVSVHVFISSTGLLTSVILNPIIYGIRTEALKLKILLNLHKLRFWKGVFETK
ncbi:PREDICTED: olfactory receptor 6-like [Nanorana parkeri]|uniref:olfactory receptor 6-like n=1 Tax=Nanorana parkeri TaxID=125878 RepID=UPI000854905D|nr:PREDICTED: olfactory receptor 6-like [Nanorana parkeri]